MVAFSGIVRVRVVAWRTHHDTAEHKCGKKDFDVDRERVVEQRASVVDRLGNASYDRRVSEHPRPGDRQPDAVKALPAEEKQNRDQRMQFILEWKDGLESKGEPCRRYGIQRRIGYKWVQRYQREGPAGLADRSRAPLHHPQQIAPGRVARILEIRAEHPLCGAPKIRAVIERERPLAIAQRRMGGRF